MGKTPQKHSVGHQSAHESANLHVTGKALYIDDFPEIRDTVYAAIGMSRYAHARIHKLHLHDVENAEGVVTVISATDIPGINDYALLGADDPVFAEQIIEYAGQSLFAVVAGTTEQARRAARLALVDCEEIRPILDVRTALNEGSLIMPSCELRKGDPDAVLAVAPHRLRGTLSINGQDHFYLEGQVAMALPQEGGDMLVYSATQHPGQVQEMVARVLGKRWKDVVVQCPRIGGGFGGKETQAALVACIAAIAAAKTGRPVKLRLDRDDDMLLTGKRHDFIIDYDVGFDTEGRIKGLKLTHLSNCGRSADLSAMVNERAMLQSDNCYYLENVSIVSHRCRTNKVSNTAFRGFGSPQGTMGIEYVIDEIARFLNIEPLDVRETNFYGVNGRNLTHYGMQVEDNIIHEVVDELVKRSNYDNRKKEIVAFNTANSILKRGIALIPVKYGISFPAIFLNQAGALVHVYRDGTVMLNHGGIEMGQGLFTKVAQVVAEELQVDIDQIKCTSADTGKIPNASPTASSASSDLYGKAAQAAAQTIKQRLIEYSAEQYEIASDQVCFHNGKVYLGKECIAFNELVQQAYFARISLSATGFYRTPKIQYDPVTMTGRPFYYFVYGAAISEVIIDTLTGEFRLLEVDLLQDVGESINPAIDKGQVEGAFLQGAGLLTSEELYWDAQGRLMTHAPSTYKIPTVSDWPDNARVELFSRGKNREDTIFRSKGVGEPPLLLAISVFHAIKNAISSVGLHKISVELNSPATPEQILNSIEQLQKRKLESRPCQIQISAAGTALNQA